ncbi:hypothetical protein ASPWEDRAFT_578952 [Aspergillus wentii DTO 134E9]|uniref:Uncharacterized protein n=1 Tax=Aspergillus wentii DTO 134E9 TaxID=1073089 RepID=A0A1L9RHN7_ASPWE|nr:uncharacterized protein ASPWEDRAFT_578952 [Aspergillus wentii DTO 134E9]OJJ34353.1 hypothetical protein ASPWEDRAFT_578952 [Aspergillus wentii DTO 134E9]
MSSYPSLCVFCSLLFQTIFSPSYVSFSSLISIPLFLSCFWPWIFSSLRVTENEFVFDAFFPSYTPWAECYVMLYARLTACTTHCFPSSSIFRIQFLRYGAQFSSHTFNAFSLWLCIRPQVGQT